MIWLGEDEAEDEDYYDDGDGVGDDENNVDDEDDGKEQDDYVGDSGDSLLQPWSYMRLCFTQQSPWPPRTSCNS